jgi:glucose/arabinose dehydrogenase
MKLNFKSVILLFLLTIAWTGLSSAADSADLLAKLRVPEGFRLTIFADDLPNARSMARADNGVVFVSTGSRGEVFALEDANHDGQAETRYRVAEGLYLPNGVAFKDKTLYVAEVNRIVRFDDILNKLAHPPKPEVIFDTLPSDKHHGWKYLRFGPDGKLYTAVGAPCNICKPPKPIYTSLIRLNRDGSGFEVLASGIRNTVGFDWEPDSHDLYFTDNGRDLLGDDVPPEELNKWSGKLGEHFGYPYCHGGTIADPEFGKEKLCTEFSAPALTFNAHNAPLGLRFYQGKKFPLVYKNQLFVALHGSWNRSIPDGYKVVLVKFNNGKPVASEDFIDGWLTAKAEVLGRPVDILELADGSLLISDDHAGLIYRLDYQSTK